ncbi:alpha-hydroxy-acid oxidizing enzyme [Marinococcus halophilus]|uniref:L-lactate oxidase n=1 Tax=Marinococcus halophilus TaxID=1371 RepID=A0A510Y2Z3_MARHA|nr:lactate 2-monooxygenase [Marinococcus halophilus]OZT81724.1 alpha-hydroxy-acid oxidizing enzyme [Marinococcus halophilus]GEK57679.1 oxidoreductase [Marinococcus halophilus]
MTGYGNDVQFKMYHPDKKKQELPVSFEDWEQQARERLADGPYHYIADGAGSGNTAGENRRALDNWRLLPRMMVDTENRDLSIQLLGEHLPFPVLMAPIGVQTIAHEEGELAAARAAKQTGVPYVASTASSFTMERIAEELDDAPKWFQLYWGKDKNVTASFLQRAEEAGYSAIVATLDTQMLSWREKDLENGYLPFLQAEGIANYLSDPAFRAKLERPPEEDIAAAVQQFVEIFTNAALSWEDLAFLRRQTNLPIVLKGVLDPEDVKKALEYDINGFIVSNHGGRQVDGTVAAIDMLPEMVEAAGGRVPVLMDSGIRRGADVIKALALGAEAVLVGRPYIYGLAVDGENGAYEVLRNLLADTDLTMGLTGRARMKDIDRSLVRRQK